MAQVVAAWLLFWVLVMGVKDYLYKKHAISYYRYPWQHTLFFAVSLVLLMIVYRANFEPYFSGHYFDLAAVLPAILAMWLVVPLLYKKDYFSSKKERTAYAVPKFLEILFQQFGFLAGLLTFNLSPMMFGLVFFAIHFPVLLFIPKKSGLVLLGGSLFGGIIFAYLQSVGPKGFLIAVFLHFLFYIVMHAILASGKFTGIKPHKR